MIKLLKVQAAYFIKLIWKRVVLWTLLIVVAELLLTYEYLGNPFYSGWQFFFGGNSFDTLMLPVLWFSYMLIPSLILLDSTGKLFEKQLIKLKGLRFTKTQIGWVNILLTVAVSVVYVVVTFLVAYVLNKGVLLQWLGNVLVIVVLIQVIQLCMLLFSQALSLVIPTAILVFTPYSTWRFNPVNLTMTERFNDINQPELWVISLVGILIFSALYITAYRRKDF
jgi:hypothetical protein